MNDATIARYYLERATPGADRYHPGKLEARVMRHPGRAARLLLAMETIKPKRSR